MNPALLNMLWMLGQQQNIDRDLAKENSFLIKEISGCQKRFILMDVA